MDHGLQLPPPMSGTSLVGRRVCRLDPPAEPPSELEKAYEERGGVGLPDASIPFHVIGRDLRTHHFLPAVLAVLLAASTATFARTAQTRFWFTPDLAPYRTLIELYREGEHGRGGRGRARLRRRSGSPNRRYPAEQ